jgi:hypothetical protein
MSGDSQPPPDFHVLCVFLGLFVLVGGGKVQIHELVPLFALHESIIEPILLLLADSADNLDRGNK